MDSCPCDARFDTFDEQLPRAIGVGGLVEQHRFESLGNDLRYPGRQHNDIEYRGCGGGKDCSPALPTKSRFARECYSASCTAGSERLNQCCSK